MFGLFYLFVIDLRAVHLLHFDDICYTTKMRTEARMNPFTQHRNTFDNIVCIVGHHRIDFVNNIPLFKYRFDNSSSCVSNVRGIKLFEISNQELKQPILADQIPSYTHVSFVDSKEPRIGADWNRLSRETDVGSCSCTHWSAFINYLFLNWAIVWSLIVWIKKVYWLGKVLIFDNTKKSKREPTIELINYSCIAASYALSGTCTVLLFEISLIEVK